MTDNIYGIDTTTDNHRWLADIAAASNRLVGLLRTADADGDTAEATRLRRSLAALDDEYRRALNPARSLNYGPDNAADPAAPA